MPLYHISASNEQDLDNSTTQHLLLQLCKKKKN